jgi:hypothetical protein
MSSFSNKKQLRFVITLGVGNFGASKNNQIILQGFRASMTVDKAGGIPMGEMRAKIYGVSQSDMNSAVTLNWKPGSLIPNTVEVYAIDGAAETLVFAGNIVNAWGDYQNMPDVYLHIQARAGFFNALQAIPPRSYKGGVDVATVMAQIARSMGYVFENNGVTTQLVDLYLPNTGMEQAKDLVKAAGCDLYLDDKILAITPPNVPRKTIIPLILPLSGLIGYPTFDGVGVNFQTLFNPSIVFGGAVKIQTDIKQSAGQWIVNSISHNLESEKPGGAWFSQIRGNVNGFAITGN